MAGLLRGKVALITGATSGIGLATACLFQSEGAEIIATGIDQVDEATTTLAPGRVIRSDAGSLGDIDALAASIERDHGYLDIAMFNAGRVARADLPALTEQHFDDVFATNVKGVLFGAARLVPLMRRGGSIIVTTSTSNRMGLAAAHCYASSKAAAAALIRTLAAELAPLQIRVNAISPGSIETGLTKNTAIDPAVRAELLRQFTRRTPLGRRGQPTEIASVALFLATEAASYVNAQEITVDGGLLGVSN